MPSLLAESAPARTRVTTDTRKRFFRELEGPAQIVSNLTPNWFASIMGTGIVAVAAASLPLQFPAFAPQRPSCGRSPLFCSLRSQ